MADTSSYSPFRMHTCRLAWLFAYSIFLVVVLMWVFVGRTTSDALAPVGIGLFLAASLLSLLSRRFAPFAVAFGGLVLLFASAWA